MGSIRVKQKGKRGSAVKKGEKSRDRMDSINGNVGVLVDEKTGTTKATSTRPGYSSSCASMAPLGIITRR